MSKIQIKEVAIPTDNPPAGKFYLAIDSADSALYIKDSAGTVTKYSAASGSGIFAGSGTVPTTTEATITDTFEFGGDAKVIKYGSGGGQITTYDAANMLLAAADLFNCKLSNQLDGNNQDIIKVQNLGVGTFQFGTSADGVFALGVGAAPTSDNANVIQMYTTDGLDLNVRDEAGTIVNLLAAATAATTTTAGVVELATTAEVDTGTDATRAITPDSLNQSNPDFATVSITEGAGSGLAPDSNADLLDVTSDQTNRGMTISTIAGGNCNLYFSETGNAAKAAHIQYNGSINAMRLGASNVNSLSIHDDRLESLIPNKFHDVTTAQRNALTPSAGWTIYNTDRDKIEWYDGDVWLNADLRKMKNGTAGTLVEGAPIKQKTTVDEGETSTTLNHIAIIGFAVDGDFTVGGWFTMAVSGLANALLNGTVGVNELVFNDTVANEAYTSASGGTGACGVTNGSRSGGGSSLVEIEVKIRDTF